MSAVAADRPEGMAGRDRFNAAYRFVRSVEGGYVNHPKDAGRATKWGVTQATYDTWRRRQGLEPQDVRRLGEGEVWQLYYGMVWGPAGCEALPLTVAVVQFDAATHHGPNRAIKLLQRAVGETEDGVFGPRTRAAVAAVFSRDLTRAMFRVRRRFLLGLVARKPSQIVFLVGWWNRLRRLRRYVDGLDRAA